MKPPKGNLFIRLTALLIIFLAANAGLVQAQVKPKFRFGQVPMHDRVFTSYIHDIKQDKKGFFWIANSSGLVRYDGRNFRTFYHNPDNPHSISHNSVREIEEDRDGFLWIATADGGLNKFDPSTERFAVLLPDASKANTLASQYLSGLAYDSVRHVLWIATYGFGLDRMDLSTGEIRHFGNDPGDPYSIGGTMMRDVAIDNRGMIWAVAQPGLAQIHPETFEIKRFTMPDVHSNEVYKIFGDSKGRVWFTGGQGLSYFDYASGKMEVIVRSDDPKTYPVLSSHNTNSAIEDRDGNIWISTVNGFSVLSGGKWHHYSRSEMLARAELEATTAFALDRQGDVWMGVNNHGFDVMVMQGGFSKPYEFNRPTRSIEVGPDGTHWFAFEKTIAGFTKEGQRLHTFTIPHNIYVVHADSRNRLWVGTEVGGMYRIDLATGETTRVMFFPGNTLGNNSVQLIRRDAQNRLWIGTEYDFFLWDEARDEPVFQFKPENAGGFQTLGFWQQSADTLWLGTWDGLVRFHPSTKKHAMFFKQDEVGKGLSNNQVIALSGGKDGKLYIGTQTGGLNALDLKTGVFEVVRTGSTHQLGVIYSIAFDASENLWLGTDNGLICMPVGAEEPLKFQAEDGLPSSAMFWGGLFKRKDGVMIFGTLNGPFTVNHKEVLSTSQPLKAEISGLRLLNELVDIQDPNSPVQRSVSHLKRLELSHENRMITFEFALDAFTAMGQGMIHYRLLGLDETWLSASKTMEATFTNLKPGDYTLEVRARKTGQDWGPARVLEIYIDPPIWQKPVFIILSILFLSGLVWGIVGFRERTLQAQATMLKAEVERRTQEIREQADLVHLQNDQLAENSRQLATLLDEMKDQKETLERKNREMEELQSTKDLMISAVNHDLRNPLNPILNYSSPNYPRMTKEERLALVHDRAKTMFALINDIMDVYRADKLKLQPQKASLSKAVDEAIAAITESKDNLPEIENRVPEEAQASFEYKYIERVLENLLSNAIKYTESRENGGRIFFDATQITGAGGAGAWRISITDNGAGIPKDKFEEIFKPFTNPNAKDIGHAKSVGIGLTFCKTIVEAHGANLDIESEINKGTTFGFALPAVVELKAEKQKKAAAGALTQDEKSALLQVIPALSQHKGEIYHADVRKLIRTLPEGSGKLQNWKQALETAVDEMDDDAFAGLLDEMQNVLNNG